MGDIGHGVILMMILFQGVDGVLVGATSGENNSGPDAARIITDYLLNIVQVMFKNVIESALSICF